MAGILDEDHNGTGWPMLDGALQSGLPTRSGLHVVYSLFAVVLVAGLLQRILFKRRQYKLFPGWAAVEIALASHIVTQGGLSRRIYSAIRRRGGSLFGLTSAHQVLINLPSVDRFMSQPHHALSVEPLQYTMCTRVFGIVESPELKMKMEECGRDLTGAVERMFLNDAAAAAALEKSCVSQKAASFVTFSSDPEQMERWELSADIRVISPNPPGQPKAVEANLQSLVRDFGACVAIPLLYGQDFLDRYPGLLDDFWKFDNDLFPLLTIGVPTWAPLKIMKEGLAARSRLLQEMEALYRRIDQYQRGQAVDFGADMSDISTVALERNVVYRRTNWSIRDRGADLALLWGSNANTQPMLFWLLVYIYSTPGLLDRVREDIAPYVKISQTDTAEINSIDLPALCHDCALMKACLFESYRMANEATSIRYVARPVTINDGAYKHELKAGIFVSAPHSVIQRDPSVYADPDKFIPDRFLEVDAEAGGRPVARYGRLKPWGSGVGMCKGRTFAEKEILLLSAAIISLWDIAPAGDGAWKLPAMIPGTGVKKPVEDIRVVITRRVF